MAEKTLFQRLMDGELPCHRVYEDQHVFAFLDIAPVSYGHTLLIPREAAARLDELSAASAAAIGQVLPGLCRAVMAATGARDYNVLQNNGPLAHQAVLHVHFHIIPSPSKEAGLPVQWRTTKLEDQAGRRIGAAIAAQMASGRALQP